MVLVADLLDEDDGVVGGDGDEDLLGGHSRAIITRDYRVRNIGHSG